MIKSQSLGLEEAREIAEAVLKASRETEPPDRPMSVAVVDNAGDLIYFARMDGAGPNTVNMAINKAYTAIKMRRDTKLVHDMMVGGGTGWTAEARDIAWYGNPRYAPVAGGVLIKLSDGTIVGAVGTSGRIAMAPMGDEELARIGAKAFSES